MGDAVFKSIEKKEESRKIRHKIFNFFFYPVKYGIAGFSLLFSVLIILKLLFYIPGYNNFFEVSIKDVKLSLIGFGVVSFVKFIENFRKTR